MEKAGNRRPGSRGPMWVLSSWNSFWSPGENVHIQALLSESDPLAAGSAFCKGSGDKASSAHMSLNPGH